MGEWNPPMMGIPAPRNNSIFIGLWFALLGKFR
jgi:hypothetical protein